MIESELGEHFKEVLRKYPTGVTVVTSLLNGKPVGGTMNSFTSVSLNPPLIAVFIMENSRTSDAIRKTGRFVVNILDEGQEGFAKTFANDKVEDKFKEVSYHYNGGGVPIFDSSLGYLECSLYKEDKIADHILFVGKVEDASVINDTHALVYHKRLFGSTNKLS